MDRLALTEAEKLAQAAGNLHNPGGAHKARVLAKRLLLENDAGALFMETETRALLKTSFSNDTEP